MAIVRASYLRPGRDPSSAAKKVLRAAKYYTERDGPDRSERQWFAADGRSGMLEEFRTEMAGLTRNHRYTYRLVLSTKASDIGPTGYHAVLSARFRQFFFVEHHNTEFPHAHVLGYSATKLTTAELKLLRSRVHEREQGQALVQEWQQQREKATQLEVG